MTTEHWIIALLVIFSCIWKSVAQRHSWLINCKSAMHIWLEAFICFIIEDLIIRKEIKDFWTPNVHAAQLHFSYLEMTELNVFSRVAMHIAFFSFTLVKRLCHHLWFIVTCRLSMRYVMSLFSSGWHDFREGRGKQKRLKLAFVLFSTPFIIMRQT